MLNSIVSESIISRIFFIFTYYYIQFYLFFAEIWGPFLVITPASTLHNWQQEIARFIPAFKIVPYWGSPQERKILRQFWDKSNLHKKSASFHIVITSYQVRILKKMFYDIEKYDNYEFLISFFSVGHHRFQIF